MISKASQKGFTLLELMVSITLLSIILLILFGAMRLGHRSIEKAEKKIEFLERLRTTIQIIDAQLQSQIPLTYEEEGEKRLYFIGQKDSFQFASNFSVWQGHRGFVKVQYSIEEDSKAKKALYVTENTIMVDQPRKTLLINGLQGISFLYFNKDLAEEEGEWMDEWSDSSSIPEKVAINFFDEAEKINVNFTISIRNRPLSSLGIPLSQDIKGTGLSKEVRPQKSDRK